MGFFETQAEKAKPKAIARLAPAFAPHMGPEESVLAWCRGHLHYYPAPRKRCLVLVSERNVYVFRVKGLKERPKEMLEKLPIPAAIEWHLAKAVSLMGRKTAPLKVGDTVLHVLLRGVARHQALDVIAHARGQATSEPAFRDVGD